MRLTLLLALFVSLCSSFYYQKQEGYRVEYTYTWNLDTINDNFCKESIELYLTPTGSICFDRNTYDYDLMESTKEGRKRRKEIWAATFTTALANGTAGTVEFPRRHKTFIINYEYGAPQLSVFDDIMDEEFVYQTELPEWDLLDDMQEINGQVVQEAVTNYHGRLWHAWFSADYPYHDGPWCLKGLPGLIFRAYDESGDHYFELSRIEKAEAFKPFYKEAGRKRIERKQFLRNKVASLENSNSILNTIIGDSEGVSSMAKKTIKYDFLETDYH